MTQNIVDVRTAFRDKILTLADWAESTFPYELFSVDAAPDQPAAPVSNKMFVVGFAGIVDRHETRSRAGDTALMAAGVVVRLVHRVVPTQRRESADTAWTDTQAVHIALMQQSTPWPADILISFDGVTRAASASGEWIVTTLNYTAQWAMTLS